MFLRVFYIQTTALLSSQNLLPVLNTWVMFYLSAVSVSHRSVQLITVCRYTFQSLFSLSQNLIYISSRRLGGVWYGLGGWGV